MKKIAATLVATALAAFALVAPATVASAVTYPAAQCDIQVSSTTVRSGEPFTVTVRVVNDVPADLSATYRGTTRSKDDTLELVAQFTAPRTTRNLDTQVTTTCDGQAGSSADILVLGDGAGDGDGGDGVADSDADAGDANGILPGTGGTDLWLLILGALLVVAGTGAVVRRRRS